MSEQPLTSEQIRAARKLLRWSQEHLAAVSGVSSPMISFMENNKPGPGRRAFLTIRSTFERAGVEFPDEAPPRLKPDAKRGKAQ